MDAFCDCLSAPVRFKRFRRSTKQCWSESLGNAAIWRDARHYSTGYHPAGHQPEWSDNSKSELRTTPEPESDDSKRLAEFDFAKSESEYGSGCESQSQPERDAAE
jgi:hypothetical protein